MAVRVFTDEYGTHTYQHGAGFEVMDGILGVLDDEGAHFAAFQKWFGVEIVKEEDDD